jgi:GTP-binding protein HflX
VIPTAIVAARDADERPETTEISGLAAAAGYEVVGAVNQRRREDPAYDLGRGKAEELAELAGREDADAVVFDGELSPGQTASLRELLPAGVDVIDRHRLVLDIFAERAGSRAARLQVELAQLRYWKPRLEAIVAEDAAAEVRYHNENDRRVLDVERRIESLRRALDDVADVRAERRERRREEGFDLVALAGYTNAGKSTLLHRLADDLAVEREEPDHRDLSATASVEDRLFETLETTTRRATVAGRRTLVTDTVGFVEGLPHEAVRSFEATLGAIRDADVAVLVVDACDPPETVREKVRVTLETLGETTGPVIPVLNKVDAATDLTARREALGEALDGRDGPVGDPVAASALTGDGVDGLRAAVGEALPAAETLIEVPACGGAEALLSWAYDSGSVADVAYVGESLRFRFAARPAVVERAERKAATVGDEQ